MPPLLGNRLPNPSPPRYLLLVHAGAIQATQITPPFRSLPPLLVVMILYMFVEEVWGAALEEVVSRKFSIL